MIIYAVTTMHCNDFDNQDIDGIVDAFADVRASIARDADAARAAREQLILANKNRRHRHSVTRTLLRFSLERAP